MAIMGWSSASMTARYQRQIDAIRRDVANQVGVLLWEADDTATPSENHSDDGSEVEP
jgi:hypothetical protein